ncbi:hypothetical protein B1A87_020185 [Arthrobacter sp. KBS0703]|nr:hypothetical protein B1A87_020185 [Arthrobacter sp. KBS0703]
MRDADELIDGQYEDHPHLRPIANTLLGWAAAHRGVQIRGRLEEVRVPQRGVTYGPMWRAHAAVSDPALLCGARIAAT